MTLKTLAVVVTDKAVDRGPLAAALAVARRNDAHLDIYCLGVDQARYEPLPTGAAAMLIESSLAEARTRADELVAWAEQVVGTDTRRIAIEGVVVPQLGLDTGISRLIRFSDVLIAARPYGRPAGALQVSVLEATLFGTGTPALVIPPDVTDVPPPEHALVAWDESDESLAAIRKALPLLRAAKLVSVVMVDPPSRAPERSDPGGALAQMLARHGAHVDIAVLSRTLPRVCDSLNRYATDNGCDLIVMGAYGHSRVREALLGGPTRDMLEDATLPIFMAR